MLLSKKSHKLKSQETYTQDAKYILKTIDSDNHMENEQVICMHMWKRGHFKRMMLYSKDKSKWEDG